MPVERAESTANPPKSPRIEAGPPRKRRTLKQAVRWYLSRLVMAISKRSAGFRHVARTVLEGWRGVRYRREVASHPLDPKLIVFESFQGRSYSCNPKALYRAIIADPRFDDYELVWAFKKPWSYAEVEELGRATLVSFASEAYASYHARAKYWISNSIIPVHMLPRDGQIYLQTWHGTPLKRLGCDIRSGASDNVLFSADEIHRRYRNEGARLTYLISPSAFATEKLGSAFGLGESGRMSAIIEEGYPRNDILKTYPPTHADDVRRRLGLPEGKRVILYAPTFRDNQHSSATGYTFTLGLDFDRLRKQLGDEYVVLFRTHYLVASQFDFAAHGDFVFDVSSADDINDLYIVSDLLITDYSSVFFDYANLGRPMIFFMHDLEEYAEQLRGLYFSTDELPGPIVRTQDELVGAVRDADTPSVELTQRYRDFTSKFTYLDDGHASERVINRIFEAPSE